MIKRVEYFTEVPIDILYDILFNMKIMTFEKDQDVLDYKSDIDSIYFIEEGIIEVSCMFDKNENDFMIETLGPGSFLNHRAVFLSDIMYVNLKTVTEVKILALSLKKLLKLVAKYGEMNSNSI